MSWRAAPWSEVRQKIGEDGYYEYLDWTVAIVNKRGRRLLYVGPLMCNSQDSSLALAARINRHAANNPAWAWAPKPEHWNEIYPVYGSEEYCHQEDTGQIAAEERKEQQEEEWGYR
jgi:hypothetical protein